MARRVSAIILGAGKSKRMRLTKSKIILDLGGRPLIFYTLDVLKRLGIKDISLVVGYKKEEVKKVVREEFPDIRFVHQRIYNGTAKAVEIALPFTKEEDVLVLYGDTPLIEAKTLRSFINFYFKKNSPCALISGRLPFDNDLGRILRNSTGEVIKIIEKQQLTHPVDEVNSGIYCFKKSHLGKGLKKIKMNRKKREFFLTDIVEIFSHQNLRVSPYFLEDWRQIIGVNTQSNLALAYKLLNEKLLERIMHKGVRIIDPYTTFLSYDTKIGRDSIIYPFTYIEKNVIIGNNCSIGPFVHLRQNTYIKDGSSIGNFIEITRSQVGPKMRAKHFSYIGDATIKEGVNIGAGFVTANYDGKHKYKTFIEDYAFIGSHSVIVAPCKIGKNALTGGGAVVTKNVENNMVVVGVPAKPLRKREK
ncbi:MAG: hypothetical protein DRP72_02875 [Candidatus Omnitrophota bacterium]|nr:MAG: hypothetical protein DRP72_02875 [Candidatus Omnitrophota bacterium]